MTGFARAVAAQAAAETRIRLRSPATFVAVLLLGGAAVAWLPDPSGRVSSLVFTMADGRSVSPEYSSSYLGWAGAMAGALWASLVGFYLVAGSVPRDARRGVGAILAAAPLSNAGYLAGKAAAHALYLGAISLLSLGAALVAFLRWGVGPFDPGPFLAGWALDVAPAVVFTAAMAVLFDVTPGLRSRAGLVFWFFLFAIVASGMNARDRKGRVVRRPLVDPVGVATLDGRASKAMPGAVSVASGLIFSERPIERVPWPAPVRTGADVAARGVSLLASLLPFGAALLFFDRFDPARHRRSGGGTRETASANGRGDEAPAVVSFRDGPAPMPSALRSVLAEARLVWEQGPLLKWPLLAAAIGAPFAPTSVFPFAAAVLLLLLGVAVAEVAAREDLAGTRGLVFAQPGVPASPVLWKTGAILLVVLALGLPSAARAAVENAGLGAAFAAGLLFTAGTAAGFGSLTGGGKLFLGVYTALWYFAVNRLPIADFAGLFTPVSAARTAAYLVAGAAAVGVARLREIRAES